MEKQSRLLSKILGVIMTLMLVFGTVPGMPNLVEKALAMQIFVQIQIDSSSTHLTLEVEPTDRIEDVKAKIQDKTEISPSIQELFYGDKKLEEGNTLQDYSIQKDSILRLVKKKVTITDAQREILTYGTADNVSYTLMTEGIDNGTYPVTLDNAPLGVTVSATISNNTGILSLTSTEETPPETYTNLIATIDGVTSEAFTLRVNPKPLTWLPNGTTQSKVYDGNDIATVASISKLNGIINGDDVFVLPGSVTFDSSNVGVGKTMIASGWGITGTASSKYTISGEPTFSAGMITPKATSFTVTDINAVDYTGSAHTPVVTIMDGTVPLRLNTDYTVSYSDNINAGMATVEIIGIGNYAGSSAHKNFIINKVQLTLTLAINSSLLGSVNLKVEGLPDDTTGMLTFMDDVRIIGTSTLPTTLFNFTPTIAQNDHHFRVTYSGDNNYEPVASSLQTYSFVKGKQNGFRLTALPRTGERKSLPMIVMISMFSLYGLTLIVVTWYRSSRMGKN